MLFQSVVPGLFQKMDMQIEEAANRARKAETAKRLDFYHDVQVDYVTDRLNELFSDPEKLTPCFVNIVKKITNQLAQVYAHEAVREIAAGTDQDREIFNEISTSAGLSVKMKAASKYVKLLKTALVRPVWRSGRMDLDILTGDILDVTTGTTPEALQAVLITHYPESGKQDEVSFSHWTAAEFSVLDYRGNVVHTEANPYRVLPFLPLWDRCPTSDFWLSGGDDLIAMQEAVNEKLTDLIYVCRMQGFGVGWLRRPQGTGGNLTVSPGTMVELPDGGALGFESQKAPIADIIRAIEALITWAGLCNGLSATALSTKTVRESGLAKVQGQRELEELRRDDIILWKQYETKLFDLFRIIWNTHNPSRKISSPARLKVDFYDPKPIISAKDQSETWERLITLGALSPVDVVMERNPDLKTREEAKEYLTKIKEEIAAFSPAKSSADSANSANTNTEE